MFDRENKKKLEIKISSMIPKKKTIKIKNAKKKINVIKNNNKIENAFNSF
jgi:hypothetical protein